jgi:RimJ/RimL family protein N-acetyltransferase
MVTLEPLRPQEFELVAEWLSRPNVNCWLSGDWRDREITAGLVAAAVRNRKNRLFAVWKDGAPVGMVALSDIELADRTAMIWYALGRDDLSGQGITTAAVTHLLATALHDMALACVYAWVIEGNSASLRVLEKAGFETVGRIRRAARLQGHQVDRIYLDAIAPGESA